MQMHSHTCSIMMKFKVFFIPNTDKEIQQCVLTVQHSREFPPKDDVTLSSSYPKPP